MFLKIFIMAYFCSDKFSPPVGSFDCRIHFLGSPYFAVSDSVLSEPVPLLPPLADVFSRTCFRDDRNPHNSNI